MAEKLTDRNSLDGNKLANTTNYEFNFNSRGILALLDVKLIL